MSGWLSDRGDPAPVAGQHTRDFDGLYLDRETIVHRLPAAAKLLALVSFLLVVVATSVAAWPAFLGYGLLLLLVLGTARLPAPLVARRMLVETPFVVFALLLPFVATGPRVDVGPLSLSHDGLVGGAVLLAKATLGVLAGVLLVSTTRSRELLIGLERLHLPRPMVAIASFMVRYATVVTADLRRMRIARQSRGLTGGGLAQLRYEAAGVGSLFVRSYERGERVHVAMLARGYAGRMPELGSLAARSTPGQWLTAATLPLTAGVVLAVALLLA